MALRLGTENKRQVYLLAGLFVVILLIGGYQVMQSFSRHSTPPPPPPAMAPVQAIAKPAAGHETAVVPAATEGKEAQKFSNDGINPALHLDRLALSESVEYRGTGRNIFAGVAGTGGARPPVRIETPAKGPRPGQPVVAKTPPGPPRPPAIDLKYFGYTQAKDKSYRAFFVHGDDIFVARTGEIVNHRYKVGAIQPTRVQVTDLGYDNTQSLALTSN